MLSASVPSSLKYSTLSFSPVFTAAPVLVSAIRYVRPAAMLPDVFFPVLADVVLITELAPAVETVAAVVSSDATVFVLLFPAALLLVLLSELFITSVSACTFTLLIVPAQVAVIA